MYASYGEGQRDRVSPYPQATGLGSVKCPTLKTLGLFDEAEGFTPGTGTQINSQSLPVLKASLVWVRER